MSGTEWRFTDEQGVERTLSTQELREKLASGKIAPSTLVWHDGMKEWAPAFTLPELSGAAIAAGRSSRASIPPTNAGTSTPASGSPAAVRPRSVPPPVPKRIPSVAPPVPLGKPHRPPMRTLTGLEPPELLESLGLSAGAPSAGGIHDEATRDVTNDGDDDNWDDATDVIPLAPKVPKEAANFPRSVRRIPSIPPPPLPNNPTPPPAGAAPAPEAPRRPTLMGLAQRKPSKPPPRRPGSPLKETPASSAVSAAADPERTVVAPSGGATSKPTSTSTTALAAIPTTEGSGSSSSSRSKPPPPLHRKKLDSAGALPAQATLGGPKRLAKTLEIDTKVTQAALARSKPQAPPLKHDAPTVVAKREIAPPPNTPPSSVAAEKTVAVEKAAASPAPKPGKPSKDSNTGTITTVRQTAEGTVIMDQPIKKPAETTDLMAPRPADISKLDLEDPSPVRKSQHTLEMAIEDHTTASEKHPESPVSSSGKGAKREDTGTTFQVDQEDAPTEELRESSSMPPEPRRKKSALEVPLSSLIAASMVWIIGLLGFFFVGRISGFKSAGEAPVARDGLGDAFLSWAPAGELGGGFGSGDLKPCSVTRQPKKWAPSASKSVPFDMRAEGDTALLGFAQGDREGVGLKIDPKTGKFEETFRLKVDTDIVRVSPTGTSEGFFVGVKGDKTIVPASAKSPRFLVLEKSAIGASDAPDGSGSSLWSLEGDGEITAETVIRVNEETFFLTFRRGAEVFGGYFGADKTSKGSLVRVTGSGGKVGKPRSATNGVEVAVVFADKPSEKDDSHWEIRIGRAAIGQVPETTEEVSIPEGGPGGDVIAPDIIGLSDGRWLLMWTEGQSGERSILAQTYDKHFAPIGDPIALSPPAGSFGQAVLGVVGTYTTVAFLQAADEGFEMWGAVLQCGN